MKKPEKYNQEEVKREETYKSAPIDSWKEIEIKHPLYGEVFLYSIAPLLEKLPFVKSVYIASNGLLRLNIKGKSANTFDDIALNPSPGKILIIEDDRDEYRDMAEVVLEEIIAHTRKIVIIIE